MDQDANHRDEDDQGCNLVECHIALQSRAHRTRQVLACQGAKMCSLCYRAPMFIEGSLRSASGRSKWLPVALIAAVTLVACGDASAPNDEQNVAMPTPVAQIEPRPRAPTAPAALTRKDLLEAAAQAASRYAGGQTPEADRVLVGRAFSIRIPFGCSGPSLETSEQPGLGHWSWSADRKNIELTMVPADWTKSAMIMQADAAATWEAVEGFWVPHPWISSEDCSSIEADPLEPAAAGSQNTIGLAAVFAAGGSRVGRREGRAYQFTIRPEGTAPLIAPTKGYRLLLEGRFESFPGGRAIACRAPNPDVRPVCVAATRLDRVAFETADGELLADWRTD